MVTVYLHIGLPKTGTTSLQRFLCKNEKRLLKLGYLYPKAGRPPEYPIAHYHLARAIEAGDRFFDTQIGRWQDVGQVFESLHHEIDEKKVQKVIISCENFSNDPSHVNQLSQALSRYDVKVIVYLRPQSKWLLSLYIETIKQGFAQKLADFLAVPEDKGDYYRYLVPWRDAFGKENLTVRLFQRNSKGNLFEDFLWGVGIADTSSFNMKISSLNVSPPPKVVNLLRHLNWIFIEQLSLPFHVARKVYLDHLLYKQQVQALLLNVPDFLIPQDLAEPGFCWESYCQKFEASNRQVAAEYLSSEGSDLFG